MTRITTRCLLLMSIVVFAACGCHRSFYREQADLEAYDLIAEKASHPHWSLDNYTIEPSQVSRMADFDSPDCPPMPLDDPRSHEFMHVVDNKPAYPFWEVNGQTDFIENPAWKAFLPLDENGVLHLNTKDAVRLAIVHSPDYQSQLESLYLSALDVSAERFVFDPQYSAGYDVQYDALGRLHPSAGGTSNSTFSAATSNTQVRRLFTTGAELVVGFANSLIWQFSGADTHTASSLINFSLVQPLLQGAGRDKILESLTLAERNLLAGVRQLERFRRGFYLDIAYGNGVQAGPGGNALNGQFDTRAGSAGGLLGLLQTQLSIRNQEANLDALRSGLIQFESFSATGQIEFFQVDRTRQDVTTGTRSLLNSKRAYRDQLDAFKRDLGLPPELEVVIDDDKLEVVNLVDTRLQSIQDDIKAVRTEASATNLALHRLRNELGWSDELERTLEELKDRLADLSAICRDVLKKEIVAIEAEVDKLDAALPKRKKFVAEMRARVTLANKEEENSLTRDMDLSIFDLEHLWGLRKLYDDNTQRVISLDELPSYLAEWLAKVEVALQEIVDGNARLSLTIDRLIANRANLDEQELATLLKEQVREPNPDQFNLAEANLIELILITAMARAESLILPPVDITAEEAVKIARVFRRDWMNARAALVDAWRQIEFNADDLESVLDIVFDGEIYNTGDNPLRFRDAAGSLGVGVQFDAPLTRLVERNSYRASLIQYQQARRAYYQVNDAVTQSMRSIIRQIEFNKVDFEVRRTALRLAIAQVRQSRAAIERPPSPERGGGGGSIGPTASRDLTDALSSLNRAQDDFIQVWVSSEVQRGILDLQMGTMRLDAEGLWIDPGAIGPKLGYPSETELQQVPEYAHPLSTIDDLLYNSDPDEFEVIPTPNVEGANLPLLPAIPQSDGVQLPIGPVDPAVAQADSTPSPRASPGHEPATSNEQSAVFELRRPAELQRPAAIQQVSHSTPVDSTLVDGPLADVERQGRPANRPAGSTHKSPHNQVDSSERLAEPRNPLRRAGFDRVGQSAPVGLHLRR